MYVLFDLIDTQWNVNLDNYGFGTIVEMDLIDTQWNVNKVGFVSIPADVGFNRYIVECKQIRNRIHAAFLKRI